MADLTLPGSIPGLLRRGSPVMLASFPAFNITHPFRATLVAEVDDGECLVAFSYGGRGTMDVHSVPEADVALDLTSRTGRAHALDWLVGNLPAPARLAPICEGAWWYRIGESGSWALHVCSKDGAARCIQFSDHANDRDRPTQTYDGWAIRVPGLRDVDPADPMASALALRLSVLHVAGVEVPRG